MFLLFLLSFQKPPHRRLQLLFSLYTLVFVLLTWWWASIQQVWKCHIPTWIGNGQCHVYLHHPDNDERMTLSGFHKNTMANVHCTVEHKGSLKKLVAWKSKIHSDIWKPWQSRIKVLCLEKAASLRLFFSQQFIHIRHSTIQMSDWMKIWSWTFMIIEQIIAHTNSKTYGRTILWWEPFHASLKIFLLQRVLFWDQQDCYTQDTYESYVSSYSFDI